MIASEKPRTRILKRWKKLESERAAHLAHWRQLAENFHPKRGRWLAKDKSQPQRNGNIINPTPMHALRVLVSGMMAGITSPSRPWFKLSTPDPLLSQVGSVKVWLHSAETLMRLVFARSNLYNCLHQVYGDVAIPGVTALHVEEDPEDLVRGYVFPIGSYALQNSERMQVDSVYRETTLTVAQIVEKFGRENCSDLVLAAYDRGDYDDEREVLHVVEPNRDRMPGVLGARSKRYRSIWLEIAGNHEKLLRVAGFDEFPLMCPRWEATSESPYASTSPGMEALPEAKALQQKERRKMQGIDKAVEPPMVGPAHLATMGGINLMPGAFTGIDPAQFGQKAEPAVVIDYNAITTMRDDVAESERRIHAMLFADLWLLITGTDSPDMTAREVQERHDEKMMQLGPALERMQDELLDPLIDRVFAIMLRAGVLPPPPEELQGVELKVEYISMLAEAQKILGTRSIEQATSYALQVAAVKPEVLDWFDEGAAYRAMTEALGAPPEMTRDQKAVDEIRAGRAQAMQQQMEAESVATQAKATRDLAQAPVGGGGSALDALMKSIQGGAVGTGVAA